MKQSDAFNDPNSPTGLKVYQITDDPTRAVLVYPDQPCFLADGQRLVIDTSSGPAVFDLADGAAPRPLFDDGAKRQVKVTFDGRYGYFKRKEDDDASLTLTRIDLDTLQTEDVYHAEGTLPGTSISAGDFKIATVSVDNQRIASPIFLGDGKTPDAPFGVLALDIERGTVQQVLEGPDFINPHLQYCRSDEGDASHDLLVQMNHGARTDEAGKMLRSLGPPSEGGVDVHVVRDDGSDWRDMPFGRDGKESCIGHQIWRGRGRSAATVTLENLDASYGWADGTTQHVVAGWPAPGDPDGPHLGALNPQTERVVLTEGFDRARFCHLACDATGLKFALDTFPIFDGQRAGMHVYVGSAPDERTPLTFQYLLNTGIIFNDPKTSAGYHAHPILSPDGSKVLFNSNITGTPQAYMATGFWS